MRPPIEIHAGDIFAGIEVLAISDAQPRGDRVYRVLHLCCNVESEMSHSRVMRRRKKNERLCRSCGQKEAMKLAMSGGVPCDRRVDLQWRQWERIDGADAAVDGRTCARG